MSLTVAIGMVRSWVAVYTLGLPKLIRAMRRMEIDSDLWEQRQLAELNREPPLVTAFEIVVRTLLGAISDITWRVEARLSARRNRSTEMNESLMSRGWLVFALALAAMPIIMGASRVAGAGGGGPIWGSAVVIAGVVLSRGCFSSRGMRCSA